MKAKLILACAVAGIAAATVGTTASADNSPRDSISFHPASGRPGDLVDIFGTCTDPAFTRAPVLSDVLAAEDIIVREDGNGYRAVRSHGTVKANAKPGEHKVSFKCGTRLVSGQFRVVAASTQPVGPLSVSPRKGVPGTKVTVRAKCEYTGPVSSFALTKGHGNTMIVKNVKPGIYLVLMKCDDRDLSTTFTVLDPKAKNAQVPVKPKGAAETGDLPDA